MPLQTNNKYGLSLPSLTLLLSYPAALYLVGFEADTLLHIKTGEWIVANGQIPHQDVFSFSKRGEPWMAHEWLAEVLLYGTYNLAGWGGLRALLALCFSLMLAGLARAQLARGGSPYLAILTVVMAFSLCLNHFTVRPHVLAWPLLILWATWQSETRIKGQPPPLWSVALMALWANLHGGFTAGLALAGFAALESLLVGWRIGDWRARCKSWSGYLIAVALAALATPNGLDGVLFTHRILNTPVAINFISEWRSPDFHYPQMLELWLLGLIVILGLRRVEIPPLRWLLLLGLIHLSLSYARSVEMLGFLAPLYLGLEEGAELVEWIVFVTLLVIGVGAAVIALRAAINEGYEGIKNCIKNPANSC